MTPFDSEDLSIHPKEEVTCCSMSFFNKKKKIKKKESKYCFIGETESEEISMYKSVQVFF